MSGTQTFLGHAARQQHKMISPLSSIAARTERFKTLGFVVKRGLIPRETLLPWVDTLWQTVEQQKRKFNATLFRKTCLVGATSANAGRTSPIVVMGVISFTLLPTHSGVGAAQPHHWIRLHDEGSSAYQQLP